MPAESTVALDPMCSSVFFVVVRGGEGRSNTDWKGAGKAEGGKSGGTYARVVTYGSDWKK